MAQVIKKKKKKLGALLFLPFPFLLKVSMRSLPFFSFLFLPFRWQG
jgi:hypothetical protein